MSDLPKAYDPSLVEEKWQSRWIEEGCFKADPASEKPAYSVVIPPPNVTGVLHLGHVLNNTIQDILVRRARQKGYEALWLPGTDHAGIATQVRVEKDLKQTTGRSRHDLGREAFLEKVWEWKEKHGGIIINQLHKLGCSCDWDRERFTMDEEYTKAVGQVFIELFKEGLIYRGRRMVNWCPVSLTALSDEEVIMTEQKSKLYTVLYKLEDGSGALHVATTRPETIMADVAVAVNPKDPRYAHLIGKNVMRPLNPTPIPIIGDEYVEIEFGTGALKITPAHDKADFEIGRKFNLEIIDILTPDGHINCPEVPENLRPLAGKHSGLVHLPTALVGPSHPGLVPQRQGGRTQERPGAGCLRTGTGLPLRGNRTSPGPGQLDSGQRRNGHMVLLLAVAFLHHG